MKHKHIIFLGLGLLLIGAACAKKSTVNQSNNQSSQTNTAANTSGLPPCSSPSATNCDHSKDPANDPSLSAADRAGKKMSNNHCTGTAQTKLTHLPMDPADFAFILPYGLMVGGHVTPVDHQYFSPTVFNSKTGTYNVYAMADSHLVDIGTRTHQGQGVNSAITVTDYRLVFYVSCRLLYYYDLINVLTPGLQDQWKAADGDLPVTSGQLIGKIGGQTLDFAVWDTTKPLTGFIDPADYAREDWKQYTADPLNFYTDDVKAAALAKYVRTAAPRSGKIDYDLDGQLIGNWFQQNADGTTTGYAGTGSGEYWTTHLSFSPYFLDPNGFLISIGNWPKPEGASQFATKESTPNPAEVDISTGLVKYNLVKFEDHKANGQRWDNMIFPNSSITLGKQSQVEGCMLVQMTAARTIKAEALKSKTCASVSGFTSAAVIYIR